MKIRTLSIFEFDNFAFNHPLSSYHQTSNYGVFQSEQGLDYDLIGLVDENNQIVAASLIVIKKMGLLYRYGYAPKGFLMDYYDEGIIKEFTEKLIKHYYRKNMAFIKVNPEIQIGKVDYENKKVNYNKNKYLISTLERYNFKKLNTKKLFDTKIPTFNSIVVLKNHKLNKLTKNTRNKIHKSQNSGIYLQKGNRDDIKIIYEFFKKQKSSPISYYYNYHNAFHKDNKIDILKLMINFEECLINLRKKYEEELETNTKLSNLILQKNSKEILKKKMVSDRNLNSLNENIAHATRCLAQNKELCIGGAITIKYKNRINILISGYDKNYKQYCPNYYLYHSIMEEYKNDYDFLDLNGITGDFTDDNPYKGLNDFKQGFNPFSFEYIGEFDFIINPGLYKSMEENGILAKEFNKKQKSINNS